MEAIDLLKNVGIVNQNGREAYLKSDVLEIMVKFAKLKVQEALEIASKKAYTYPIETEMGYCETVDENSILKSYNLDLIK
jgi:hypothetical protein